MSALKKEFKTWILVAVMILKIVQEPWAQDSTQVLEPENQNTLQSYIDYALKGNPRIKAVKSDIEAQRKQITIASSLPDPMVMSKIGASGVSGIGASQRIPFPTKILAKKKAAQDLLLKEEAKLEQVRSEVVSAVTDAYSDLYSTERMMSILEENMELLRFLEESARVKYTAGKAPQSELVKLQIELARVEDELRSMALDADSHRRRLAALLNVENLTEVDLVSSVTIPKSKVKGSGEDIMHAAVSGNYKLDMMKRELDAAEEMVSIAKQWYLPDFQVSGEYMGSGGMGDSWSLGVNVEVPLWFNKNEAEIDKANEMVQSMRSSLEDMENSVRSQTRIHINHLNDARRKMKLYTDALIPQARQVVELTQTEYRSGVSGIMELIDSQRTLLDLEDRFTKEQLRAQKAEVELIKLTGVTR